MSNPSVMERESCPDCLVLERENKQLREQVAVLEKELGEQSRRWGLLATSVPFIPTYALSDETPIPPIRRGVSG